MTYYSNEDKELSQAGIREGELAIYTGTINSRQPGRLKPDADSHSAYVRLWQGGQGLSVDTQFHQDGAGQDVLEVQTGEEKYIFLRDRPSGYIQQTAGPAAPIVVANFGAIPLRVDTLLGKFTVHAGTMLRLDESAPRREKKKVLLTVSSQYERPLKSAELWDGGTWRRLNIREDPAAANAARCFAALDGKTIVQYLAVNGNQSILMMDSPEPDPDYEIFVTAQYDQVTLRFNRTDYQDGRIVERSRTISTSWGKPVTYDLQKLKESRMQAEVKRCTAEMPGLPDEWKADTAPVKRRRPLVSDKLRDFLEDEDAPEGLPDKAAEKGQEDCGREEESCSLAEILRALQTPPESQDVQTARERAVPELPEGFPD